MTLMICECDISAMPLAEVDAIAASDGIICRATMETSTRGAVNPSAEWAGEWRGNTCHLIPLTPRSLAIRPSVPTELPQPIFQMYRDAKLLGQRFDFPWPMYWAWFAERQARWALSGGGQPR